jgi:hypothetical protein
VSPERFVCPYCGRASAHPMDLLHRYCSCCGSPPLLPKDCEHWTAIEQERAVQALLLLLRRPLRTEAAGDDEDPSSPPRSPPRGESAT